MFGLASPRRPASPRGARRTTLCLEILENRDCPSTLTLNLSPGLLQNVTLSGDLTGAPNVAFQTIDLGGSVPATQVQTDGIGHYSVSLQATSLGTITAVDDDGSSNTATATLASPTPVIKKLSVYTNNGMFTFTGQVVAPPTAGVTLTLTDGATLQNNPVKLRADGTFAYSIQLNMVVDPGRFYTATATDCWGQSTSAEDVIPW